ncbi:GNAT family N-acetyltransferase [Neolewinella lacunae]|uniref:GNAT family N-acetyltransferase n=1 Tax=Neolewinella lacunae TaxID=1517758 RepID=A0A923TB22_9BACT|nr:GNAT family N-acetyltransferase [Neolewinella lacunae]MBC6996778.1 GNAT family N-acetyltransferase [Neolewinella lacunae]MDN3637006.1 GNAT family N-acetyltransferase [Neolewinella lacunae]
MLTTFLYHPCAPAVNSAPTAAPLRGAAGWSMRRFRTAEEICQHWPEGERADGFWLRAETLAFLRNHPQGITTEALLLEHAHDGRRVWLSAQPFSFSAAGQVSDQAKGKTSSYDFRRRLLAPFSFRVLCIGQFLVSGPYAQDGLQNLGAAEATDLLSATADALMDSCRGYTAVLLKDLYPTEHPVSCALEQRGYHALPADPVMGLHIPAHWNNLEDYLLDLSSKYRVRYRRARGKMEGLERRRLSAAEVDRYQDRIYHLYQQTSAGADYNAATLSAAYFPWLATTGSPSKGHRSAALSYFHGYFTASGEMVGFTSGIGNGKVFHAHFLGLEDTYKRSHHLYHNMLYDLLATAIEEGYEELDYGRTALEIKSSVGATPERFACQLKARPRLLNQLVPIFTPAVYQATPWEERNPFRN